MERLFSPLRRRLRAIAEMPTTVLLRKLEFTFFFLFVILATTCIVLPLVVDILMAPLYIAAGFSIAYAIVFYFFRYRVYVHFGFMLHSGIFLAVLSTIFFESGFFKVGTIMIVIGLITVFIILVYVSVGKKVIVKNSDAEREQNQARQNANALNNNPVVDNGQVNPLNNVLANGDINHPMPALPNGPVNHIHQDLVNEQVNHLNNVLANGDVNHPVPALPNDPVNHHNQDLANGPIDVNLVNGHAIQPREDPGDQVDQHMEVDEAD